ncbi:MAG: ABC transporter ATP-binding protein, partial [Firmicutes bacterium]|nr:ABC transporter ATP-binding protein [Bacillota bacterium]
MRDFLRMVRTYVLPYKKYLGWAVVLNVLSAVFNVFSFTVIIPMLKILFNVDTAAHPFIPWDTPGVSIKDKVVENAYYYVGLYDPINVLLVLCAFLAVMTLLKTSCYFGSSAVMIPIKTGITRDLRRKIYNKILALPIGFFSQERKGDIIARMSGDVSEVESSISASIDTLIKNPILIIIYAAALVFLSWQLTLFTIVFTPLMGWIMGVIGKQLKRKSLQAQALWSDVMSQVEETLGGLRIIKAFRAEKKMDERFGGVTESMRKKNTRVSMRQALAHPVSEFLGTVMILVVVIFGGYLIIDSQR